MNPAGAGNDVRAEGAPGVLIVTRDFPPNCSRVGWMVRAATLADFLAREGLRVHVLAVRRPRAATQEKLLEVHPDVEVEWVASTLDWAEAAPDAAGVRVRANRVLRGLVSRTLGARLIDVNHLDVGRFHAHARRLVRSRRITTVIVSSPPHSLQLVGLRLKREFGPALRVIADFRDPWTLRRKYRVADARRMKTLERLERAVLESVDRPVFVSRGMREMYVEKYGGSLRDAAVVENGYSEIADAAPDPEFARFVASARADGRVVLGYFGVGGLQRGRRDGKDLYLLVDVLARRPDLAARVALVVQGEFTGAPEAEGLGFPFRAFPGAAYAEARAHMGAVDVGLVVYTERRDAPLVMGGKVYDYIGSGCALLVLAPENAASLLRLREETGKPFFADIHEPADIARALEAVVREADAGTLRRRGFTAEERRRYARDCQYRRFLELVLGRGTRVGA